MNNNEWMLVIENKVQWRDGTVRVRLDDTQEWKYSKVSLSCVLLHGHKMLETLKKEQTLLQQYRTLIRENY